MPIATTMSRVMQDWSSFRAQFPVTERFAYMNHAAVSPLPIACRDRMQAYLAELTGHGAANYPEPIRGPLAQVRSLSARMLGTKPGRIFVVRSTTQGIGVVATGLQVGEGDNVVLAEKEFPANIRPWLPLRRRGVELRFVRPRDGRVGIDDVAALMDARTRAVSLSFVQFLSGFRLDVPRVAELCRRHDALFVVDGIQGVSVFPLDVEAAGVDFLSADSHKWMLGPEGVGIGYASARAMDRIDPALEGWMSVERPFDFFDIEQPLKKSAARFEEGAYNVAGIHGLVGSLELLLERGAPALSERILHLTDVLCEGLRRVGWSVLSPRKHRGEKSGIVLTTREGVDFDALEQRLRQNAIVASIRGGALRVSPHAYNTEDEIERVVAVLSEG